MDYRYILRDKKYLKNLILSRISLRVRIWQVRDNRGEHGVYLIGQNLVLGGQKCRKSHTIPNFLSSEIWHIPSKNIKMILNSYPDKTFSADKTSEILSLCLLKFVHRKILSAEFFFFKIMRKKFNIYTVITYNFIPILPSSCLILPESWRIIFKSEMSVFILNTCVIIIRTFPRYRMFLYK